MISMIDTNYSIDDIDYAYNIEDIVNFHGGKKVKVYIPILMPDINIYKKDTTKQIYTEGIIINNSDCKPLVDKSITFSSYIYATIAFNSDKSHVVNSEGIVPAGTKFKCYFMQGDINKCYIDTDIK